MLTPEQYNAFQKAVKKFDDYIQNHPEIIEEAARKWAELLIDVKDVALWDEVPFKRKRCAKNE